MLTVVCIQSKHLCMKRNLALVTRLSRPSVEIDNVATGAIAKRLREKSRLSLRELGRKMDLSAPYLCDLENGKRNWSEDLMTRFCANCCDRGRA